ncbi:hypothetical protein HFD88_007854 [Aspergillus terreus]|nr:hypothetical protein HFD88_007854 [Aspergillus terreus]
MSVLQELDHIQKLLSAEADGDQIAHQELLEAIRRLQLSVESPLDTMKRINMQARTPSRWLHVIAAANGKPVQAAEIAKETTDDAQFVMRILRFMAVIGLCDEDGEAYVANERTNFHALSGSVAAVKTTYDLFFPMAGRLVDYMRGPGLSPDAESLSKFTYGVNHVFELMESDPQLKKTFDEYMFVEQQWFPFAWFEIYPPAQELASLDYDPTHPLIVDLGGGRGQNLIRFKQQYPNHPGRLILQDLPSTVEGIPELPDGIEAMGHDFFTSQPVHGASIYLFRHAIHDWSDPQAEHILRQLVPAMDREKSTLLIIDRIMPEERANLRDVELDMLMWLAVGGIERTETQWEQLLRNAGLELINVWRSPKLGDSVLEARLAGR